MRRTLFESFTHRPLTEAPPQPDEAGLKELAQSVNRAARAKLGRSLSIRQVDAGSCNGCELEIHALNNAFYDLERFGLHFVASPRHADQEHARGTGTYLQRYARSKMGGRGRRLRRRWWYIRRQLRGRRQRERCGASRPAHSRLSANAD